MALQDHLNTTAMAELTFLPGVPSDEIIKRLEGSDGNEIGSGKFFNPNSSAALAINCFGWFLHKPELLPAFPSLEITFPAVEIEVEYQVRFPWSGGRHPWLDAAIFTPDHIIGIESKRYEPFRDTKQVAFSEAYSRDVWGANMSPYIQMRNDLSSRKLNFKYLDAAQLVKHAFGLVTQANKMDKKAQLVYLYSEPKSIGNQRVIETDELKGHREEIAQFSEAVADAEVKFFAISYREWVGSWAASGRDADVIAHGEELLKEFRP